MSFQTRTEQLKAKYRISDEDMAVLTAVRPKTQLWIRVVLTCGLIISLPRAVTDRVTDLKNLAETRELLRENRRESDKHGFPWYPEVGKELAVISNATTTAVSSGFYLSAGTSSIVVERSPGTDWSSYWTWAEGPVEYL